MEPWLTLAARRRPDRVALQGAGEALTYAELHARARALEVPGGLIEHPPGVDFAVALHACLLRGVPAVPLDPRLGEAERSARAAAGGGRGGLLVVHTAGTTAAPKAVRITADNVMANALGSAVALGHDRAERWLCPLPLSHVGGLMVLLRSVIYATTAIVVPFEVADVAGRLRRGEATLVSLVPTMLGRLLDAGLREPPNLRLVLLGGAPAAPALLKRAAAAGVPMAQTQGITEGTSQVPVSEAGEHANAGRP
ncbi:MAG: AMP-binding protein, partial [Solirubrobacteraceae bacterium]